MKKKIVIVVVVLGIILSLFVGCKDDLIETLEKVQAYVEISVKLPKSLTPDNYKFEEYDFVLQWYKVNDDSHKDKKEFEYEEIKDKVIVYQFDPGEYIFELSSYDGNEIKSFGKASTSIERGQREQLEIPMTYYVYGEGNGFIVEHSVITLKGELEFKDDMTTISVPDGMKLVIEDGSSIKVEAGKTLTFNSAVEASSNLVIDGDLNITDEFKVNGNLEVTGDLTVSEEGNLNTNGNLTFETIDVEGKAKVDSLIPKEGVSDLSITIASNGSIETTNISNTYEKVSIDGGGALKINSDAELKGIEFDNNSKLEVTRTLSDKEESGIKLSGGSELKAGSIETSKLTSTGNNKIISDDIQIGELVLADDDTLTLEGKVTVEELSGSGKAKVEGEVEADNLLIESGVTLDLTGGTMEVAGEVILKGELALGAAGWSFLDETGIVIDVVDNGSIMKGATNLVWYKLYGAKAKYYKADDEIQLEFIKGNNPYRVTPAKKKKATTEDITRVGSGVTFDLSTNNELDISSGELILEDGSTTIIYGEWWAPLGDDPNKKDNFNFDESVTIETNAGAIVRNSADNKAWIGGPNDNAGWILTGGSQIKFDKSGPTNIIMSSGISNDAQVEINEWGRTIGNTLVIESNTTVIVSTDLRVGPNGEIEVKNRGVLKTTGDGGKITLETKDENKGKLKMEQGSKLNETVVEEENGTTYIGPNTITHN